MTSTLAFLARVCIFLVGVEAVSVPSTAPSSAASVDSALLSISLEFFTFPAYAQLASTTNCLAQLTTLRGTSPAVRIGGTTQDRATYDSSLSTAVNYTVASSTDAPTSLTFGPSFFTLAAALKGPVTIGLNRQLDEQGNTQQAAVKALSSMSNLYAIELGNEPEFYASGSPIIPSSGWNPTTDGASQKAWQTALAPSVGNIFQAAVYLQYPTWSTTNLIPLLGSAITYTKTFSGHSYPQSACNGASTNLQSLMSHSGIVSYTKQYNAEAAAGRAQGKTYVLGDTNSATCGGGGISPTFGAALWIVDYVLQAALNGISRLYFHQGTIGNCQYCFWGRYTTAAPFYGAYFVSQFLGTDGHTVSMLDDGTGTLATYAVFSASGAPLRVLVLNSAYFNGTGSRAATSVPLSGLPGADGTRRALRMSALSAAARVDQSGNVTIGGGLTFTGDCVSAGTQVFESVSVQSGQATVSVLASEALIVFL
ncbi:glycoside hydrolase family 79 protein [Auriscalpium vulgare]|uniref:Glycoside hydrolase family 79 protein n=1 Tax=Auriscalpium vulgare TaxID=40419 RepID=A0ACB8RUH2_9AGAM|nr:glycoside hydrolase family 79 protein [Auriscalpium vulgare]